MKHDLSARLNRLWEEVRGAPPVHPPVDFSPTGPDDDPADSIPSDDGSSVPTWRAEAITGHSMVILYSDSRGQQSERQVVCKRLDQFGDKAQLVAWCSLRNQPRAFRIDRILRAIDASTGEVWEPGHLLIEAFTIDRKSSGRYRFGLTPKKFADFNAALNIMAFVARCDGNWHALEASAIEDFITACWLRFEYPGDVNLKDVTAHVGRLSPDAEVLWTSVARCAENPALASLIVRHLSSVIDADGIHHPLEIYWGTEISKTLRGL
ncbi:WYL domain-containing protein [Novosphingobium sp. 28-62-57]|uniref:WYL domain-containing protein n=1 Tax=Novosphingobium sp. 28-62-57 TaxID=1970409 RepID=UPI0025FC6E61|nr:WYL domain-containing protein [Novosphingobium sp. 28-62-57]